jgi:hypothetical protein
VEELDPREPEEDPDDPLELSRDGADPLVEVDTPRAFAV